MIAIYIIIILGCFFNFIGTVFFDSDKWLE